MTDSLIFSIHEEHFNVEKSAYDICPICLENLDTSSNIVSPMSCSQHFYHQHCLLPMIFHSSSITCPMDRKPFNSYTYHNITSSGDIVTTNVYWYISDEHIMIIFDHFLCEKFIGTNVHSVEYNPSDSTIVDILLAHQTSLSFSIDIENTIEEIEAIGSINMHGWQLVFDSDYHDNICSSSIRLHTSSLDLRHLTLTFSTYGNNILIDSLLEEIHFD